MRASLKENSRAALALSAGALGYLAFTTRAGWLLALVSWAPLLVAIEGVTPRRAFGLGWLSGFVMTALGYSFLVPTLVGRGELHPVAAIAVFIGLAAYLGLRAALLAWVTTRIEAQGWPRALALLAFGASELLVPSPLPFHFGAALDGATLLLQIGDLGGPIATGALAFAASLGIAELWHARRALRSARAGAALVMLATPLLAAGYGSARIAEVDAIIERSPRVRVGVVHVGDRGSPRAPSAPFYASETRRLRGEGADLVLWSEGVVPGSLPEEDLGEALRATLTGDLGVPTILGAVVRRQTREGDRIYNAAIATDASGLVRGRYDKRKLVPFGETLPLGDLVPAAYALAPRAGRFDAGERAAPVEIGGHAIATTICFEDVLPGYVRSLYRENPAELLVNLGSDGWFPGTEEPELHLANARARAIEHRTFMVRAVAAGPSGVIDATGRDVRSMPKDRDEGTLIDARWMHLPTLYERIGDAPWWTSALAACALAAAPRRRRRPAAYFAGNEPAGNEAAGSGAAGSEEARNDVARNNVARNDVARNNVARNNVARNNVARNNVAPSERPSAAAETTGLRS